MVGPRYTIAQTRARVAALEIAADHIDTCTQRDELDAHQFKDVARKLRAEAVRLKAKAQEVRRGR